MSVLRRALLAASESEALEHQVTTRALSRRIALRFIAGETLDDGIGAVREVAERGCKATLDFLGEAVTGADDAGRAQAAILTACRRIADESLPSGISVKPTQMGLGFDAHLAFELIGGIAADAKQFDGHVNIDMEGSDTTEATVTLCERLREAGHDNVGCALQSYLHRTQADVERLTATGASLRLIKGAYDEPPEVAYQDPAQVDASFERSMEWLLANGTCPRIATHDDALIERTKRTAIRLGRSPDDFEFQMLYGVRTPLQRQLVATGWRMRVYIPFGARWFPYFMRRIAERPANLAFFLRAVAGS
ncbi:MAG TPA: proline dehydrogenase family protein [Euzebyales bacterium]|nr:proline dehydrogenase family protein [Euzebyales bacterium]